MSKQDRERLAERIGERFIDVANELVEDEHLPFHEVAHACIGAALNAVITFAFTRLSKDGVENGEKILEGLLKAFEEGAREAIEERRAELAGGPSSPDTDDEELSLSADEDDEDGDPWT